MQNNHLDIRKRRGRKKITFIQKQHRNIKELVDRFLESESAGAYIGRSLLAFIALGGILVVGAVMPNIFSAFGGYSKKYGYSEKQLRRSFYYLRGHKLVKIISDKNGVSRIKITKLGHKKLMEFAVETMSIKKPEQWDNKWRAIVFDIPERYRAARDSLRRKLRDLGFYQMQRSIFMHPYPVEDEILFIASLFEVERFIEVFTIESMLDDKPLRLYFEI